MVRLVAFIVLSIPIIWISRASLRQPRSHGFFRFFAWEFILGLVLLNLPKWFDRPLAWYQVVSWVLLLASFIPLVLGVRELRSQGKPSEKREGEPQLLGFESTSQLVTSGIYHFIRHPMYSSLLLLAWGAFFKSLTIPSTLLVLLSTISLYLTARADEAECLRFFGPPYAAYIRTTRRFIPYLF